MTEEINNIVEEIQSNGFCALSKDSPRSLLDTAAKMKAYGLIDDPTQPWTFKLTAGGHDMVRLGGFDNWLVNRNMTAANNVVVNKGTIGGSVVQDSSLSNSKTTQHKTATSPKSIVSKVVKFIGVIASIATIYAVYKGLNL